MIEFCLILSYLTRIPRNLMFYIEYLTSIIESNIRNIIKYCIFNNGK